MSSVCIRFEQLQAPRQADAAVATRQQIRTQLVNLLNEIQRVCGSDAAPFASTDVSYLAYVDKEGRLAGIITIQKRTRETLEDDIAMGATLAFYIGNAVPGEAAARFRWCPVSGEYGQTRCGVTAVTAAHTWAGLSRRKLTMGTRRSGRRTWIMRDQLQGRHDSQNILPLAEEMETRPL
jgi:hypothetical protein